MNLLSRAATCSLLALSLAACATSDASTVNAKTFDMVYAS